MRLKELSAEQLEYLHALHVRGYSPKICAESLAGRWPDAHRYGVTTLHDYFQSDEGRERTDEVRALIREKAAAHAFADRGSRLDLLNERVESLRNQLRMAESPAVSEEDRVAINMGTKHPPSPDVKVVAALNAELRQTVSQMQKEMDPLSESERMVAPALAMMIEYAKIGKSPSEVRAEIEAADAEVPS